jgi:hypothetical protein
MDDEGKWERYGALGGIVFVILLIVAGVIGGSTPNTSDSAAKILKHYQDNKDGIKVSAFLNGLAAVPVLWWAGSLWARLRRAEGGQPRLALVAVLGLLLTGAAQVVAHTIDATVALELKDVGATEAKFFYVLTQGLSSGGSFGLAGLVLATSVLALRAHAFPAWLGWIGVLDGILFLVAGYGLATTSGAFGAFGFFSFVVWVIWLISTSVSMFRGKEPVATVQ